MSDERLRELERSWKESGSAEDESAWLQERARTGDMSQERLELAAYVGWPAAQLALRHRAPDEPLELAAWVRGLGRWGREPCVEAALAAAACVASVWAAEHSNDTIVQRLVHASSEYFHAPTPAYHVALRALIEEAECHEFHRARYGRAALLAARTVEIDRAPGSPRRVLAGLTAAKAKEAQRLLEEDGAEARIVEDGQGDPRHYSIELCQLAPRAALTVVKLANLTGSRFGDLQPLVDELRFGTYDHLAARTAAAAADVVWAPEGLTEERVREEIRNRVSAWALGQSE